MLEIIFKVQVSTSIRNIVIRWFRLKREVKHAIEPQQRSRHYYQWSMTGWKQHHKIINTLKHFVTFKRSSKPLLCNLSYRAFRISSALIPSITIYVSKDAAPQQNLKLIKNASKPLSGHHWWRCLTQYAYTITHSYVVEVRLYWGNSNLPLSTVDFTADLV